MFVIHPYARMQKFSSDSSCMTACVVVAEMPIILKTTKEMCAYCVSNCGMMLFALPNFF